MDCIRKNWRLLLLGLLLATATLAVFWPVVHHEFINYDDPLYITLNPHVSSGLTWANVVWAFTGYYTGNWHPLTWLSHILDVQLFGLKPAGPHLANLLLHTANSLLLLLLLRRLTGTLWRSALVAALFALHPLHVESVAWAAERKDVLSTFFFLLTLLAYAAYAARKEDGGLRMEEKGGDSLKSPVSSLKSKTGETLHTPRLAAPKSDDGRSTLHVSLWYGLALFLFALGLMSKPMLVTLPCVLLLLDYWPLQRVELSAISHQLSTLRRLLLEKLPFFALSLASCLVTVVVQHKGGAVASIEHLSLRSRLANATVAYATYLQQMVWPVKLSVFYPLPATLSDSAVIFAAVVLLVLTGAALFAARRHPYGLVGWLWYLGVLVPVIGLVQVGMQAHADRYTYLPSIGIFIAIIWSIASLKSKIETQKSKILWGYMLTASASVVLVALTLATYRQVAYWRNSRTLFQHAVEVANDNYVAWQCLGLADLERDKPAAALTNFYRGLECARLYGMENGNKYYVGATLQLQGKGLEAIPYLEQASVAPEQEAERAYRLGLSLTVANRLTEAEAALKRALEAKPQVPEFQLGMAALLQAQGQTNQAEQIFRQIVVSFPTNAQAHKSLADFLVLHERYAEAEPEYGVAVGQKPGDVRLRCAYAAALTRSGKIPKAVSQLQEALKLEPNNPLANFDFAELLSGQGRDREAIARYDQALAADPEMSSALNNLAWLLATAPDAQLRNGPRAVELAARACALTQWKEPFLIGTLAAAYAEAGRFPDAVAMAEKARDQARATKLEEVAKRNEELLALYRVGKPYRDGK